jgi:thiamine kinase-like enzyme
LPWKHLDGSLHTVTGGSLWIRAVADLNDILDRLEVLLGPLEGEVSPLDGGITNRNFRARLGGREYVVRLPGAETGLLGIDREAEHLAAEGAAALGIGPAVSARLEDCLVTEFVACGALEREELEGRAEELARLLGRFHRAGLALPRSFWVADLLVEYAATVGDRGGEVPSEYGEALAIAARIAAVLGVDRACPCHNDLLAGNIISAEADGRLMLVDWEYAGMGHPYFDLGNLSVNNDFAPATDERMLTAYHGEPPSDARRAALSLMRLLSDAREAAWGVVQAEISELEFDFEEYAGRHFERLLANAARGELAAWLEAAKGVDAVGTVA